MTIDVHVPIRVVADPGTLIHHPERVVAAAKAGVARALARSREEVLDAVGGYLGVALDDVDVHWHGERAAAVPASARRHLAQALADAVRAAAEAAGVFDYADAAADLVPPLSQPPEERLDDDRLRAVLRAYRVTSYQGGSEWLAVNYASTVKTPDMSLAWGFIDASLFEQASMWFEGIKSDLGFGKKFQMPAGSAVGFITLSNVIANGQRSRWALVFTKNEGQDWSFIGFDGFWSYRLKGTGKDAKIERVSYPPPVGNGIATWMDKPASDEAGIELMDQRFGQDLRDDLTKALRAESEEFKAEEIAQWVEQGVGAHLAELWKQLASSALLLDVQIADRRVLLGLPADAAVARWDGEAYFIPFTRLVARQKLIQTGEGGLGSGGKRKGQGAGTTEAKGQGEGEAPGQGEGGGEGEAKGGKGDGKGEGKGEGEGGGHRARPRYPSINSLFTTELVCESFRGERRAVDIGKAGSRLQQLIEEIAFRLAMEPCGYAATFCVNAARVLGGRATAVGRDASYNEKAGSYVASPGRKGNLGLVQFAPTISPAIHTMRYLGTTAAMIEELKQLVLDLSRDAPKDLLDGDYADNPVSWRLRFLEDYAPEITVAVATMFVMTCRILLLQMLRSSKEQIQQRIDNFDAYAPFFELVMTSAFQREGELEGLRDRLKNSERLRDADEALKPQGIAAADPWLAQTSALVALVRGAHGLSHGAGHEGEIVREGGVVRIRDSQGALWSQEQIEIAILLARGTGEGADPLVKQIFDIPEMMEDYKKNPQSMRNTLWKMLNDMIRNNAEQDLHARNDWLYAFQASKIHEDVPNADVPGTSYKLGGIHLETHKQIAEFFRGHPCYAQGIEYAFDVELGKQGLKHFFEFTGIVLLSVLCPPAGFAAGVEVAAVELDAAYQEKRLYQSLIDPEKVLSQAEVELDLYVAWIGFALSLLPEVGTVIGAARQGIKSAFKEGITRGVAAAGEYVAQKIAKQVAEALARDLFEVFIRDMITAVAINEVIQDLSAPIVSHAMEELELLSSTGGPEHAMEMIDEVIARHAHDAPEAVQ